MSADSWQRTGMPSDRTYPSGRVSGPVQGVRASRPVPPLPPRRSTADREWPTDMRTADRRGSYDDSGAFPRPPAPRYAGDSRRPPRRPTDPHAGQRRPPAAREADPRGAAARAVHGATAAPQGSRLRGSIAVVAMFLLTLAGAGIDSFLGTGLGTVTLVVLALATALATLLVRRRDLVSVLVAPPLVFVAVAAVDVSLAPSATLSLPTIATLLIRGFPAMGIATGLALLLGLFRRIARR